MTTLKKIDDMGQSIWLDYIDRQLLHSGELARLIAQDGIDGITSNPAIFLNAITTDPSYAKAIRKAGQDGLKSTAIYEQLVISDIREAADQLRHVYQQTHRRDGYVSLEVSPKLANNANGTIVEARRLWSAVDRENLMIKVPATDAGMIAITQLIAEGINVNATLLFSYDMYAKVAEAYLLGLEQLQKNRASLQGVASVASFFISRIDSAIEKTDAPQHLFGKVAIANAKHAYQHYLQTFSGPRWENLLSSGAQSQRLLWASTGTKNPEYSDVLYIEELIGQQTVNTAPPSTIDAFRDHGHVRASLTEDAEDANIVLHDLELAGISLTAITAQLLEDGIHAFDKAYDAMIQAIADQASLGGSEHAQ